MKYLDLDNSNTWIDDFYKLIFENDTWEYILSFKENSYSGGKVLEYLSNKEENVNDQVVLNIIRKAKNILVSKYSFVVGYHGCRISDINSYLKYGIKTSNPSDLIKITKNIFNLDHYCPVYFFVNCSIFLEKAHQTLL